MPIAKGEEWGSHGMLPSDAPVVASDAAVARAISDTTPSESPRVIGVEAGDLARTLGIRQPYDRETAKQLVPVDAIQITLDDGNPRWCVAHTVIGRLLFGGQSTVLMNAAFVGKWNVAPRAHPGDGLVDVVAFSLAPADRLKAIRRMTTGSHVPHPDIEVRRRSEGVLELGRPRPIRIDGQACGRSSTVQYRVISEAIVIAAS